MSFITNGGSYAWKITNNGTTYSSANLIGGTLKDALYEKVSVGNVIARTLELELWNVTLDPAYPIVLSLDKVPSSGATTTVAKGTYFIDTIESSPYSTNTRVVAYDALLKAEVPYMKTGSWTSSKTDYSIVTDIVSDIGVTLDSATATLLSGSPITISEAPSIGDNGTTERELLSVIGILRGGNWIINDANKLQLVLLSGNGTTISVGDEVVDFDVSPTETIKRVEIWAGSSTSFRSPSDPAQWEAAGGTILSAQMAIMGSQTVADDLLTQYGDATYIPYEADGAYFDPDAALGTSLTIKNDTVLLSQRSISIDVLAPSNLSADPTLAVVSYYPYLSPVEREVKQQTEENYAAITVLDGSIESEVQRATEAEGTLNSRITQSADGLQAQFTNFVTGQEQYIRYDANAHSLQLGESDSNFQAQLSNTELAFTGADGQKAAWISNTQLNIEEAVIRTDEQFLGSSGKWVQQVVNDHFQIKWVAN